MAVCHSRDLILRRFLSADDYPHVKGRPRFLQFESHCFDCAALQGIESEPNVYRGHRRGGWPLQSEMKVVSAGQVGSIENGPAIESKQVIGPILHGYVL